MGNARALKLNNSLKNIGEAKNEQVIWREREQKLRTFSYSIANKIAENKQTLLSFLLFWYLSSSYFPLEKILFLKRQLTSDEAFLFGRQLVLDLFVLVEFHRLKEKNEKKNKVLVEASPLISGENRKPKKMKKNETSESLFNSGNSVKPKKDIAVF